MLFHYGYWSAFIADCPLRKVIDTHQQQKNRHSIAMKKNSFAPVQNWPLIFSEVCMKATYPTCLNLLLCPIQMWSYLIASDLFVMSSDISSVLLQGHHTIILLFLYFWYNHPLLDHKKKIKSRSVSCICSMINEHFRQQYRQVQHTSCRKSLGRMA